MRCPSQVWKMLSVERYAERWPLIAKTGELEGSAVTISGQQALLHKRRVTEAQATGKDAAYVCDECREAFGADVPWMCKNTLANDLWLRRWDFSSAMLTLLTKCCWRWRALSPPRSCCGLTVPRLRTRRLRAIGIFYFTSPE